MTEIGDDAVAVTVMSRNEKRKLLKKEKRQQRRREIALREKEEEEARSNDAEEQSKLRQLEQQELDKMEIDRREFEERERTFLLALELNRRREQEEYEQERERQTLAEEYRAKQAEEENPEEMDNKLDWEYVEEGPAEIIWKGNEIIVKKKRVRVSKKNTEQQNNIKDVVRPVSNPLAPQSELFENCKSGQQILDTVAQEVPNFGTEQDKAHCPFHLKTGACRFGSRCSRVHFYPDKSCTLLMKNMYGGLGLIWEQDEGLEHTDEEIEHGFEEFYEDVHTEFLKFGEIVNFKVCRNGSPHLRGNVYVHYKSLESAVLAYKSTNGRYFAGKQVLCEFVNLTRWKVAICGEYMRSRLMMCSRGSACNFIHCFRNPGGDYEWADWDRKAPAYWISKMSALFGNEDGYVEQLDNEVSPDKAKRSATKRTSTNAISDSGRRNYSRSRSRELHSRHSASYDDNNNRNSKERQCRERQEVKMSGKDNRYIRGESPNLYSGDDKSDRELRQINNEGQYGQKKGHRSRCSVKRNSESGSDRDMSVKEGRERFEQDYRSYRSKPDGKGKSTESDSGSQRYHDDKTIFRQKTGDSCRSDYERDSRQEKDITKPEDNVWKQHRHRHRHKGNFEDDVLDPCTSCDEDAVDRRKSLRWCEQCHAFDRDNEHRLRKSHPKYESRRLRKDRTGSNVSKKEEGSERDEIKVKDELVTAQLERYNPDGAELEFENELACRHAALEKLQQKQLYCAHNVEIPVPSSRKRTRI